MKLQKTLVAFAMALCVLTPASVFASSHREAPISALDHSADDADWYAFVSYDHPDRVTMILNVDGFLEPSNGPNYFPFDPNVRYVMNVDNNRDGEEDIKFEFRIQHRNPPAWTVYWIRRRDRRYPPDHVSGRTWLRRPEFAPDLFHNHGEERRRH